MAKSGEGGVECGIPKQAVVKEVHVLRERDEFRGCVMTLKDAMSDSFNPPEFEIMFSHTSHFTRFHFDGDLTKRILKLEVRSTHVHVTCKYGLQLCVCDGGGGGGNSV